MIYYPDTWIGPFFKKKKRILTNKKVRKKRGRGDFYSPVWLGVGVLVTWATDECIHGRVFAQMCVCMGVVREKALRIMNPSWAKF